MLIFVSDLHLVDDTRRASFEARALFQAIRSRLKDVDHTTDPVSIVLLGDIFELLKSKVWFDKDVRPWHTDRYSVGVAANTVLQGIAELPSNKVFFDGLKGLQRDFGVTLQYIPGNHDGLIADTNVPGLRSALRTFVPGLPGTNDQPFEAILLDEEHGVVAEHGHELDTFNRLHAKSGAFVPGDAVVVEMLVGLPAKIRADRGALDEFSPDFKFLHEMDNVDPQTLSGLMRWLEYALQAMDLNDRRSWESSVSLALRHCVGQLRGAMKQNGSQPLARRALRTLQFHQLLTHMAFLRKLARIPSGSGNEFSQVAKRVSLITARASRWKVPPDLYIAGHTHAPLQQVFATTRGDEMTYLNTGTWRRVLSPVRSMGAVAFREAYHEAFVCIHRREFSRTNGRYELRRHVRSY